MASPRDSTKGVLLAGIHRQANPVEAVRQTEAIFIGGGNSFRLLDALYRHGLIDVIRERVLAGVPYLGISAGSNVACPTIRTTNDMPIIQPPDFAAFDLIPFQINPHYLDAHPEGHQGETREERILEFIELNPAAAVAGLREGCMLRVEGDSINLIGEKSLRVFRKGEAPRELTARDSLSFLL